MAEDILNAALARIESALVRADNAARKCSANAPAISDPALPDRHESLRKIVNASLGELDTLIARLERAGP